MGLRRSFRPTNLVKNSDFYNGASGWAKGGGALSVSNKELTFLADTAGCYVYQDLGIYTVSHKWHVKVKVKADSPLVSVTFGGASFAGNTHSGSGEYENISGIFSYGSTVATNIRIQDNRASGWQNINVSHVMVIDLNACGVPASILALSPADIKAWCELNIPNWFDGTMRGGSFGGIGGLR